MTIKNINQKLQEITRRLVDQYTPEKIILFGSYAWGTPDENSDVDLFIVKKTDNTRATAREIDGSIFPRPFPIDIIVYTPDQVTQNIEAGDFFIQDILHKGKILYVR